MSSLSFIEYRDKEGDINKIICREHVNLKFFMFEAKKKYKKAPHTARHYYRVYKYIRPKKVKGKRMRSYNIYLECDERTPRAEPITIGYF
jgi:hypothetical protein